MIGHPRERRLLAFHEGRLADGERRRIAAHLADCQQCRDILQGHRAVRAVFRLDAPPASGGVLERALATRAAGGVMVLPVVDPGSGRPHPRPGVVALLAGAAALLLLGVFQVVPIPVRPITGAWEWWSRTIAEWRPFGDRGGVRVPNMLSAPVARSAVLDPARLRPMTATYQDVFLDRDRGAPRTRVFVRGFTLTPSITQDAPWLLHSWYSHIRIDTSTIAIDPVTLSTRSWSDRMSSGDRWTIHTDYRLTGTTLESVVRVEGSPPDNVLRVYPPGSHAMALRIPGGAPVILHRDHRIIAMTTVDLHEGWSGSFADMRWNPRPTQAELQPESYYVDGSERVTVPAGTFEAWRVRGLRVYGESGIEYWYRKSDGLLLKEIYRSPGDAMSSFELLSVTYP